ncbi:MAG TPA: glutathione S-transferase N-terminal domain-containing protein [Gammaproteobacteria bacterium]|nr:glutathione S-transferase N-terminal domain-containing protein [Gammaproteobacteria bacterium]
MKLYFSPGACSMSCHIALEETKTKFEAINVGKKADEAVRKAYLEVNPLGAVPALQLNDKKILTQNVAILEYIADTHPQSGLLEKAGTEDRAETMRWLSLVSSDLHKSFSPLFAISRITNDLAAQEDIKKWSIANIEKYLNMMDLQLQKREYLSPTNFSVADCYFFTIYQWTKFSGIPTEKFKALNEYSARIAERPAVKAVREREAML